MTQTRRQKGRNTEEREDEDGSQRHPEVESGEVEKNSATGLPMWSPTIVLTDLDPA